MAQPLKTDLHVLEYWHVFRRRWRVAALTTLAVALATLALTRLTPPVYQTQSKLLIRNPHPKVVVFPDSSGFTQYQRNHLVTQMEVIRSLPVVEKLENTSLAGVKVRDRIALFNSSGSRTDCPVSFTLDGEGLFKILVTDLSAGNWQVRKDGRVYEPAMPVSGESGLLYLEGPAGSYTLLR